MFDVEKSPNPLFKTHGVSYSRIIMAELSQIDVAAKRQYARDLRAQADAIDAALDLLVGPEKPLTEKPMRSPGGSGRGKQPGAMSEKWKGHLAHAYQALGDRFKLSDLADLVRIRSGRDMRPAELKRHLQAYVDAGHVSFVGKDNSGESYYKLTEQGLEKIGFPQQEKSPSEPAEGLFGGHVAERSNAPDS